MKKHDVPQHQGNLSKNNIREVIYATDDNGNYTTALSSGWEPKTIALDRSLEDIDERAQQALDDYREGRSSILPYLMERHRMDLGILAGYVGMWQWRVKRHFKPENYRGLSDAKLSKYAQAFDLSLEELKNFNP